MQQAVLIAAIVSCAQRSTASTCNGGRRKGRQTTGSPHHLQSAPMLSSSTAKRLGFVLAFGAVLVTGLMYGVVDLAHAADLAVR